MIRFRSLQSRIVTLFLVLILAVQMLGYFVISTGIRRNGLNFVNTQLDQGELIFQRLVNQNAQRLTDNLQVLAKDAGFRAAAANPSNDAETIATLESALGNSASRIHATHAMLFGLDGNLRASTSNSVTDGDLITSASKMLAEAEIKGGTASMGLHAGFPYQVVVVPVNAPRLIGWVAMMVPLDKGLTQDMLDLSLIQVTILARTGGKPWQAGPSTLSVIQANDLAEHMRGVSGDKPSVMTQELWGSQYRLRTVPLYSNGDQASMIVLQRSMTEAIAPYTQLQVTLLILTPVIIVIAIIVSFFTVRRVTEPLRQLTEVANRLGAGDYDAHVVFKRDDEVGKLSVAFGAMREGIAKRESEIKRLAYWDTLTDLPNRAKFAMLLDEEIAKAREQKTSVFVLMMDLNRFKTVNDVLGHAFGDTLLQQMAERLVSVVGDRLHVARPGGDEFIIMGHMTLDEAYALAQRIQLAMEAPFTIEEQTVDMGAGIGLANFPEHGDTAEILLNRAEVAMYAAKAGSSEAIIYHPSLDRASQQSLSLLSDMRHAIDHNEFQLFVQPKISLLDGRVAGMEALVRWQHPERGMVFPDQFIPFAEQTGFIRVLTRWVLERAAELCRDLYAANIDAKISVNLSTRDLLDQDLPQKFFELLNRHHVRPQSFCLEITESAIMDDPVRALQTLERLHQLGVELSIDDFGTGYSSLAYLKRLPVDELKIDKSFVMNMERDQDDVKLVRSTIDLGHNMGLRVVAEGIENVEVWDILSRMGCDQGQGYFMSRPMSAARVIDWIAQWKPPHLERPTKHAESA